MSRVAATPKKSARVTPGVAARVVSLDDLVPDPANLRLHPERSKDAIASSVKELGAARSIVVDKDGVVRAGNGTLEAARAAGIREAVVVETDGKQLVVVKRPDWTAEQALAYAIADNRTSDLSKFDYEALGAALQQLRDVQAPIVGFDSGELDMLLSADWRPKEQVAVDSYTRDAPGATGSKELTLVILAEHAEEIAAALQLEMTAGVTTESEALLRIVRRDRDTTRAALEGA
jgi:hypothetical protein